METRIERMTDEERNEFVAYSFDRVSDGMSNDRYYETEQEAREAAKGVYGNARIWKTSFARVELDPDFDDYHDFELMDELLENVSG